MPVRVKFKTVVKNLEMTCRTKSAIRGDFSYYKDNKSRTRICPPVLGGNGSIIYVQMGNFIPPISE